MCANIDTIQINFGLLYLLQLYLSIIILSQPSYYSNSDNDNDMNDNNNDINASSISEYNINDESHHFDSDGSFIEKSN